MVNDCNPFILVVETSLKTNLCLFICLVLCSSYSLTIYDMDFHRLEASFHNH